MLNLKTDLGIYDVPGLAGAYPELRGIIGRIMSDRVARLPWIPSTWLQDVTKIQNSDPATLYTIAPALLVSGIPVFEPPKFADSADKRTAWEHIHTDCQAAIVSYAAKQQADGKARLEQLYANSAFWDAAYSVAVHIRDAPAAIITGVSDAAGNVAGGIFKSLLASPIVWVAAGVAAMYFLFPFRSIAKRLRK